MEALIGVLVDAIIALVMGLMEVSVLIVSTVIPAIVSLVIELTTTLMLWYGSSRRQAKHRAEAAAPAQAQNTAPTATSSPSIVGPRPPAQYAAPAPCRPWRPWLRWLTIGCSALFTLVVATLVVINHWFLDDLARWLLAKEQARTGIAITAEAIEGNLFTGHFQASGITIRRTDHPAGLIDLTVRKLEGVVAIWRV
ncbi:MAG TPA: hypothetical protein VHX44_03415, partial [Planctomycetota bacterium]|nr:hypothetical protein [Planctomycetota bacterium]